MMGSPCRFCGASVEQREYCSACQRPLESSPKSLVGQTVGNHRLNRYVGEGPIGAVFEALHTTSNERVRLKVLDTELLVIHEELIESASQLIVGSTGLHDGLPELIDLSLADPEMRTVSVVWQEGNSLREIFSKGPMSEKEACVAICGVLETLDALHSAGLSHRDLKPDNVLIAPKGSRQRVHIMDVGPSLISSKTRIGAFYRSPEQARGGEIVGPASDIYSCGAILYEALCGKPPFEASNYDVLMSKISLRRPPPLNEVRGELNPMLVQIVSKAMEPMPGERYRSALDMHEAIREFMTAPQPESAPETKKALPQKPVMDQGIPPIPSPAAGKGNGIPEIPNSQQISWGASSGISFPQSASPSPSVPSGSIDPDLFEIEVPPSRSENTVQGEDLNELTMNRGSIVKIAGTIFMVLAIIVGGGLIYYTVNAARERETLTNQFEASPDASPDDTEAQRAKSQGTVRIRLNGLPENAAWFVDNRRLGANPFRAPRNPAVHKIRVEAPGYRPFETEVSFGEDQEINVKMRVVSRKAPPSGFKAYTHGYRANQRPPRRDQRHKAGNTPDPFGAEQAPDSLRQR